MYLVLIPGEYDNILEWLAVKREIEARCYNHTTVTLPIDKENEFFPVSEEEVIKNRFTCQSNFVEQAYILNINVQYPKNDNFY